MRKISQILVTLLDSIQRRRLLFILILIAFGSALEVIGIGMIIPIVMTIMEPEFIEQYPQIKYFISFFAEPTYKNIVIYSMISLLVFYVIKSAYLLYMTIEQGKFIYDLKEKIGLRLFSGYIHKSYPFFLLNNSSQLIRNLTSETANLGMVIRASMTLIVDGILFIAVVMLLLYVEPIGTISIFLLLIISAVIYQNSTKNRLLEEGKARQFNEGKRIQHIQQGLSSIKDVKILGRENEFLERFSVHNTRGVMAERFQFILASVPRLFLEFVVILGLVALVFILFLSMKSSEDTALILGIYAVAIFRLLPSVNRILGATQKLRFSLPSVTVITDELSNIKKDAINPNYKIENRMDDDSIVLNNNLNVNNLFFKHQDATTHILEDINFTVKKGTSLGIVGGSGAGKSTLIDLIMGLLDPTKGEIFIDDINIQSNLHGWQKNIGYVAQTIHLTDDSIRKNIAFGVPESDIDDSKVKSVIEAAQLKNVIEELPKKYATFIGEQGIRLSGGQRQRIGIARALYHDPSVLIFDEATSALDHLTESEVMETINRLHGTKTIIMVSHRINTLSKCDYVIRIERGKIVDKGSFEEIVNKLS